MKFSESSRIQPAALIYSSIGVQALSRPLQTPGMTQGDRLCNLRPYGSKGRQGPAITHAGGRPLGQSKGGGILIYFTNCFVEHNT